VILRFKSIKAGGLSLQITAFLSGVALLCYTLAFLYTDVVRAMLLYYLTPVWSTLLAAAILRESITWQRIVAIILAIIGMLVIFGLGLNFPVPRNIGDWLGILSGFVWAIAIVRIRKYEIHSAVDMTIGFFFWSMITSFVLCFFLVSDQIPSIEKTFSVLPWLIPFIAIAVIPGAFASLWGPKYVSPGLAGLLMMTEIIFGSITAALFANEPFGGREIFGIILISSASLFEPVYDMIKSRTSSQRPIQ
jgi:drug/metabolite transporter (DMT)-like permease